MIHLDTSFLIRALMAGSPQDVHLREWLRNRTRIGLSALSWTEFLCGPVDSHQVELVAGFLEAPVPFTAEEAALAARLFNLAGRRRGTLIDCMIAATALRSEAALATANPADFRRFASAGLEIVSS